MKRRVFGLLLVAALVLGVSAITAGCGGGGGGGEETSLEDYFQRLQTISNDLGARGEALDSEFEAALGPETSDEDTIATLQRLLGEGASAFRDALNGVESLDPPAEVRDTHSEFVQEARSRADLVESLAERAAEAESLSDLEEVFAEFNDPDFEAAAVRFADACRALEQIAADNDIQVDLDCE